MNKLRDWVKEEIVKDCFHDKEILITGGTGSLGKRLIKTICENFKVKGIRIYSRDELKQWELKNNIEYDTPIAFLIGDVRDRDRLKVALKGADIVINCAAMKQIGACEYNPTEAIKTNIESVPHLIETCIEMKVEKLMHISTDKAVYPTNLYGATKAVAEKAFIHGNVYSGHNSTQFSCCRYGNVLGSRGSIIPLFKKQYKEKGVVTITEPRMTRFWIELEDVAAFILYAITQMEGGEIFVPKMPSNKVLDIAKAVAPDVGFKIIGVRPNEKLHECLVTKEESIYTEEKADHFVIRSAVMGHEIHGKKYWSYDSSENDTDMTMEEIKQLEEMK